MVIFWFLVCYVATQLANQLHQTRTQVVRSNKVARKRLTESNGTPAMDPGQMNVVLKPHSSSVQFNSHLFLSPIGARTLKMPVPYLPPNVGAYTRTPSHQPLVFGRKGTDHLP